MYADGDSLQYIDKTAAESYLSVRSYPTALNKKVSSFLLKLFKYVMLFTFFFFLRQTHTFLNS